MHQTFRHQILNYHLLLFSCVKFDKIKENKGGKLEQERDESKKEDWMFEMSIILKKIQNIE